MKYQFVSLLIVLFCLAVTNGQNGAIRPIQIHSNNVGDVVKISIDVNGEIINNINQNIISSGNIA
jgi:hypothetical protein